MAEKDGYAIPKRYFSLQKNNPHRWSQVDEILSTVENYQVSNSDHLAKVMYQLKQMTSEVQECPQFQFLGAQLDNLLTPYNKIRYTKHLLILAGQLLCISPAAYRMLRNSRTIILPCERLLRDLKTRSFQNNELPRIFEVLKPEQRFVNILFDEVKLI